MTTIDNSTVCGKDNCCQSPAQCASESQMEDRSVEFRFADAMTDTSEMISELSSAIESAGIAFASKLKAVAPTVENLPKHMQEAWLASYASQLGGMAEVYERAIDGTLK